MAESDHDVLLHDPLSEVTRRERRMLLACTLLGVGVVKTGLVPTKIEALGVEFDKTNQQALLFLLALVVGYFFAAFVIYAAADFLAWRRALLEYEEDRVDKYIERARARREPSDQLYEEAVRHFGMGRGYSLLDIRLSLFFVPVSTVRATFEFFLPLVLGVYAFWLLWAAGARI